MKRREHQEIDFALIASILDIILYILDNDLDLSIEEKLNDEVTMDEEMETDDQYKSPDQISSQLITLSLLPESRWRSLLNLDVIRVSQCTEVKVSFISLSV